MAIGWSCTGTTFPLQVHPKEEIRKVLVSHGVESRYSIKKYVAERVVM